MSDKHPVRSRIIATVAGGLILSFVLEALGHVDEIGNAIDGGAVVIWRLLWRPMSFPVWVQLTLVLIVAIAIFRIASPRFREYAGDKGEPVNTETKPPEFDEVEADVLAWLVKADGRDLSVEVLSGRIQKSRLRTQSALERLIEADLVQQYRNIVHGSTYGLTRKGRELLIRLDRSYDTQRLELSCSRGHLDTQ